MFFVAYDFCSLKLFKFKTEGQTMKQKLSRKSHKTEIKILTNTGLALLGFEKPSPEGEANVTFQKGQEGQCAQHLVNVVSRHLQQDVTEALFSEHHILCLAD